jgi:DNA-binding response OmpR family regulator
MNKEQSKILVIEDNPDTRRYLETVLSREFQVITAENAVLGIEQAKTIKPDIIVLDIVLPIINGYDACSLLKQDESTKRIPIIFLSSKNTVSDITHGLGLGADDYLPKPFDYKELIARIKARIRERSQGSVGPRTAAQGKLKLMLDTREVFYGNTSFDLTQTEFDILRFLVDKLGTVVTRDDIIKNIWRTEESETRSRTIDVHIRSLRKKIPELKKHVISIYGEGYKFEE